MANFSETDKSYIGPEVLSAKPVETTDEELRVYKQETKLEKLKIIWAGSVNSHLLDSGLLVEQ